MVSNAFISYVKGVERIDHRYIKEYSYFSKSMPKVSKESKTTHIYERMLIVFYPWVMYLLTIRITEAFGLPKPSLFCNVQRDVASLPSYSKLNSKCDSKEVTWYLLTR